MTNLTASQDRLLQAIDHLTGQEGIPPCEVEIAAYLGITQPSVHYGILRLVGKDMVSMVKGQARSIRILRGQKSGENL